MDWRRRHTLRLLVFLACSGIGSVALTGCTKTVLEPATKSIERRSIVRVTVEKVSGDVLEFKVHNLSKEPLTVIKSEIEVETVFGVIRHPPGTKAPVYEVAPGGQQLVALKFTASGLRRHDPVNVHFDRAIRQRGQPVAMDPVLFYVVHSTH